jgi:hypothetical protein
MEQYRKEAMNHSTKTKQNKAKRFRAKISALAKLELHY